MGDLWGNSFAVSCSSATDCWVMGQSGGGG
jgi:hypothetical protein